MKEIWIAKKSFLKKNDDLKKCKKVIFSIMLSVLQKITFKSCINYLKLKKKRFFTLKQSLISRLFCTFDNYEL